MTGTAIIVAISSVICGCGFAIAIQAVLNRRVVAKINKAVPFLAFRASSYVDLNADEQFIGAFPSMDSAIQEALQGANPDDACLVLDVLNREWIDARTGRPRA